MQYPSLLIRITNNITTIFVSGTHKRCTICRLKKPLGGFAKHPSGKAGLRAQCKTCTCSYSRVYRRANPASTRSAKSLYRELNQEGIRARAKLWYQNNKDRLLPIGRETARQRAVAHKQRMDALKDAQGCSHCETRGADVLQFHHTDPATKLFKICDGWRYRLSVVEAEIAKCTILCNPCHVAAHRRLKSEARRSL